MTGECANSERETAGLLTVYGTHEEEVEADRADVWVTIRDAALLSDRVTLSTISEVAELTTALTSLGIPESDIHLYSADARVDSRTIGRSSSATCRLRVQCKDLTLMPKVILTIRSAKHASADSIGWQFSVPPERRASWLAHAVKEAQLKVRSAASELGVEVGELHCMQEVAAPPDWAARPDLPMYGAAGGTRDLLSQAADPSAVTFSQTRRFVTTVELVYRTRAVEPKGG